MRVKKNTEYKKGNTQKELVVGVSVSLKIHSNHHLLQKQVEPKPVPISVRSSVASRI